jgi:hypothetical protein
MAITCDATSTNPDYVDELTTFSLWFAYMGTTYHLLDHVPFTDTSKPMTYKYTPLPSIPEPVAMQFEFSSKLFPATKANAVVTIEDVKPPMKSIQVMKNVGFHGSSDYWITEDVNDRYPYVGGESIFVSVSFQMKDPNPENKTFLQVFNSDFDPTEAGSFLLDTNIGVATQSSVSASFSFVVPKLNPQQGMDWFCRITLVGPNDEQNALGDQVATVSLCIAVL